MLGPNITNLIMGNIRNKIEIKFGKHSCQKARSFAVLASKIESPIIVLFFTWCWKNPWTDLWNVLGQMYFYHLKASADSGRFSLIHGLLEPTKGYAQIHCAERFSALKDSSVISFNINYFVRKVACFKSDECYDC